MAYTLNSGSSQTCFRATRYGRKSNFRLLLLTGFLLRKSKEIYRERGGKSVSLISYKALQDAKIQSCPFEVELVDLLSQSVE